MVSEISLSTSIIINLDFVGEDAANGTVVGNLTLDGTNLRDVKTSYEIVKAEPDYGCTLYFFVFAVQASTS